MNKTIRKLAWWIAWIIVSLLLTAYYANALVNKDKSAYLPGKATDGHYQIELSCESCHLDPFGGIESIQKSCVKCHKEELKRVEDSHPKSKFTDPRNADRVAILDARYCVTCHVEHKTEKTLKMGVTMPEDYCYLCHQDVAKNRPSHKGMAFDSCDDAGCHNYHDNKALYEDYLVKHMNDKDMLEEMSLPQRNLKDHFVKQDAKYAKVLTKTEMDMPLEITVDSRTIHQWSVTAHAKSGVNCKSCHEKNNEWIFKPGIKSCEACHEQESKSFLASKHGMRQAQKMSPLKVGNGRLALSEDATNKAVNCNSCHEDHLFNTEKAAIDACLGCHEDEHSKGYRKSKHFKSYQLAQLKNSDTNSGVTCAGCHMPRIEIREHGEKRIFVDHNQNNTLRPNEKMVRTVCMNCHGLKFSLESLADADLINNNFVGLPKMENKGFAMAREREELKRMGLIKDDN